MLSGYEKDRMKAFRLCKECNHIAVVNYPDKGDICMHCLHEWLRDIGAYEK